MAPCTNCANTYFIIHYFQTRALGNLNYFRVWHDNSGRDDYASWYLSAILVRDIQTNEVYEFICNKWMACEKGDGQVRKEIMRKN